MVIKEVIELAVAGGWWEGREFLEDLEGKNGLAHQEAAETYLFAAGFLMGPAFWRALGRSLEWDAQPARQTPGEGRRFGFFNCACRTTSARSRVSAIGVT